MAVEHDEDKHREAPGPGPKHTWRYILLQSAGSGEPACCYGGCSALRPQADDGGVIRQGSLPSQRSAGERGLQVEPAGPGGPATVAAARHRSVGVPLSRVQEAGSTVLAWPTMLASAGITRRRAGIAEITQHHQQAEAAVM
jgi:hypothetical protein